MTSKPQPPSQISRFSHYSTYTIAKIDYLNESDIDFPENAKRILTHQYECLNAVKSFFQRCYDVKSRFGLIILPMETDKSFITSIVPYYLAVKKMVIITSSNNINKQLLQDMTGHRDIDSIYIQHGIIEQSGLDGYRPSIVLHSNKSPKRNDSYDIVITNVNDIIEKNGSPDINHFKNIDFVIIYETHDHPEINWDRIIDHYPDMKCLFLTTIDGKLPVVDSKHNIELIYKL